MKPNEPTDSSAVERAFRKLLGRVNAAAVVPPATEIFARGRRRRTGRVILAGVAVAVLMLGGYSLIASPAVTPQPANTPTVVSPSAARPSPSGSRKDTTGKFPAGYLLHENDGGERVDNPLLVERCFGRPLLHAAVVRSVGELAAEVRIHHDLYVYADEATARQIFGLVRQQDLRSCVGFPDASVLKTETPSWGDEAAAVTVAKPADGANEHTGKPLRIVVLRVGTAVAVFRGYPEIPQIDQDALAVIPRLCLYDPDCRPPANLPTPLETLRNGGDAWVAVLDTFAESDPAAKPGAAMAAAAERGYHASIVPIECDEGAGEALGLTDKGARYVALYFSSGPDAEAFVAALPTLRVRTLAVRTQCVLA